MLLGQNNSLAVRLCINGLKQHVQGLVSIISVVHTDGQIIMHPARFHNLFMFSYSWSETCAFFIIKVKYCLLTRKKGNHGSGV